MPLPTIPSLDRFKRTQYASSVFISPDIRMEYWGESEYNMEMSIPQIPGCRHSGWKQSPEECLQFFRDNLPRFIQEEINNLRESIADTLEDIDTLSAMLKD